MWGAKGAPFRSIEGGLSGTEGHVYSRTHVFQVPSEDLGERRVNTEVTLQLAVSQSGNDPESSTLAL